MHRKGQQHEDAGAYKLWVSVLRQAVDDVRDGGPYARQAAAWLESTATEPTTARWVAQQLGIDGHEFRRHVGAVVVQRTIHNKGDKHMAQDFTGLGEFLKEVRDNPHSTRLRRYYVDAESRGQSMSVGAEGGFAVPTQFLPRLFATPVNAIVRPRCTVIPAGDPPDVALSAPALDTGPTCTWIAEGVTKPETSATFKEVAWTPHELCAHIVCTDKLIRNEPTGELLAGLLRREIARAEDEAFLSGSGVGRPLGILGAPATISVTRCTAGFICFADVRSMLERLLPGGSPVWVASPSTIPQLAELQDSGGNAVWRAYGELLGLPLLFSHRLPALGTTGDLLLCDLSHYVVKDGTGPFVGISKDSPSYFTTNQAVVKVWFNVDGQPWLSGPVTPEGGGSTLSPFVVLT